MNNFKISNILLESGQHLFYASEKTVFDNIKKNNFQNFVENINLNISDLQSNIYEGGLKIWEGSIDLCNYIDKHFSENELNNKQILELGCGAALPTIVTFKKNAKFAVINDFNDFVIECFAKENFNLNNISDEKWLGLSGSWINLIDCNKIQSNSFDLILTSETVYNQKNFEALHSIFDKYLTKNGKILLAAKFYYFGLNTSIIDFEKYVQSKNIFHGEDVWVSSKLNVSRKIIKFTRNVKE